MKLLFITALTLPLLITSKSHTKQQANDFLRNKRAISLEKPWETAKDVLEEDETIAEFDKELLEDCTKEFHEMYENYDEAHEDWIEEAGGYLGYEMPTLPTYGCTIGGQKINLTDYAGKEWVK